MSQMPSAGSSLRPHSRQTSKAQSHFRNASGPFGSQSKVPHVDKKKTALTKESEYGVAGIKVPLQEVAIKAEEVWGPALGGHEKEETLKAVLSSLEQYRDIFRIPGTLYEAIKKNIGSAFPGSEVKEMEVKGRNLSEGVPRSFTISSNEILEALTDPLNQIVSSVKNALEQTPPELGADIAERGMMLTGGGALLRDLDRLLAEETGLPVLVAEDPLTCVVRGCGMALERMERLGAIFTSE